MQRVELSGRVTPWARQICRILTVSIGVPPPMVRIRSGFGAHRVAAAALGQGVRHAFEQAGVARAPARGDLAHDRVFLDSVFEATTKTRAAPTRAASSAAASAAGRPNTTRSSGR
jgi:hypothetical protein